MHSQYALERCKLALEPIVESTADPNSYGSRPKHGIADVIEQCFKCLARKDAAQWVRKGDIKGGSKMPCCPAIGSGSRVKNEGFSFGNFRKIFVQYVDKE